MSGYTIPEWLDERLAEAGFGPILVPRRYWRAKDGALVEVADTVGLELSIWDGDAFVPYNLDAGADQLDLFG